LFICLLVAHTTSHGSYHFVLPRPILCLPVSFTSSFIRQVNYQLLEVCRPEAVILRAGSLPRAYVKEYLMHQEHLSASRVIRTFADQVCSLGPVYLLRWAVKLSPALD
jgi:hypothetical protein